MFAKNQTLIVFIENKIRFFKKIVDMSSSIRYFFSKWLPFRGFWGFGPDFLHVVHNFIDVSGGIYAPPPAHRLIKNSPAQIGLTETVNNHPLRYDCAQVSVYLESYYTSRPAVRDKMCKLCEFLCIAVYHSPFYQYKIH